MIFQYENDRLNQYVGIDLDVDFKKVLLKNNDLILARENPDHSVNEPWDSLIINRQTNGEL